MNMDQGKVYRDSAGSEKSIQERAIPTINYLYL